MNPETNKFEMLKQDTEQNEDPGPFDTNALAMLRRLEKHQSRLLRPNGEPVPETWTQFSVGELVEIKGYTFKVAYIGETAILFEPAGLGVGGNAQR